MGQRQEKLIEKYWIKDRERKQIENSMINYNQSNLQVVSEKLINYVNDIGGTNLQLIAETINPPQITFKMKGKQITYFYNVCIKADETKTILKDATYLLPEHKQKNYEL